MAKRKEQTAGANTRSVLIVDDEEDILELIELTLLRMGLDVDRATSVKMAIEKARSGNYDLCLTDMRLPDGEGLELVQFISDNVSDLPAASCTANPCMKCGCPETCSRTRASLAGLRTQSNTRGPTLAWKRSRNTSFITFLEPSKRSIARLTQNFC
jgi:CheY-like chemotaxis protein